MSRSSISEIDLDRGAVHTASLWTVRVSVARGWWSLPHRLCESSKWRILRVPFL